MGRPQRPLPHGGVTVEHAQQLRLLQANANLTVRALATKAGLSPATISEALGGEKLPTWSTTAKIVTACGGDPEAWYPRWRDASRFARLPKDLQNTPAWQIPARDNQVDPSPVTLSTAIRIASAPAGPRRPRDPLPPLGPPPLPVTAETPEEFIACLHRVKIWADDPSIRFLAMRAGLPSSTLHDLLSGKKAKLPAIETVRLFLNACGITDPAVIGEWVYAWRRLRFAEVDQRRRRGRRHLISA